MIDVGLFDGSFRGQGAIGLGGENSGLGPKYIKWIRDERRPVNVFTDMHIRNAVIKYGRNIAWIVEPDWFFNGDNFGVAKRNFPTVLTSNMDYVDAYSVCEYVPTGGSWIDLESWGVPKKLSAISMMTTDKQKAPGHRLRAKIMNELQKDEIPVSFYGRGSFPISTKHTALDNYMFSIVVESYKIRGYFTEKLIDCFALGVFPIYWGDPMIGDRFCEGGIVAFDTIDELFHIIAQVLDDPIGLWNTASQYIRINQKLARRYVCAEDWIFEEHPNEFT